MALKVGELFATLNLDDADFSSGLNEAKNSAASAAASIAQTLGVAALGKQMFSSFTDFESAFAGVMKTVDETARTTYDDLQQSIINMSKELPASATEIAAVAEAAGQLGIGADQIMDFTRVMIDLGESTNLSATDAATTLAQFANVMGTSQGEYSNLGSTIVALGNSFATTEADIAAMAQRMAGAGAQVGMSEADVLGFAAALSSVGIESQAGGSAFSTFASKMSLAVSEGGNDLAKYAKVAGMTSAEFKKAFQEDATGAILTFIDGLGKSEDGIKTLANLGITDISMTRALLAAAGASDMFASAVQTANGAYSENNALSEEAAKRYATVASRIAMLKNRITEMLRQFGEAMLPAFEALMPIATKVIDAITNMSTGMKQGILGVSAFLAAIGPAKLIMSMFGSAMTTAGGALSFLISPVGIAVGAFALLYKNSERVRNTVAKVAKSFKVLFAALKHGIKPLDAVYKAIRAGFGEDVANEVLPTLDKIGHAWDSTAKWLSTTTKGIKTAFNSGMKTGGIFQGLENAARFTWARVGQLFQKGADAFKGSGVYNSVSAMLGGIKTAFTSGLRTGGVLQGVENVGRLLWNKLKSSLLSIPGMSDVASSVTTTLSGLVTSVKTWFSGIDWSGIWDGITGTYETLKTKVSGLLGSLPDIISGFIADAANFTGSGQFAQLGERFIGFLSAAIEAKAGGGAATIINAISGMFSELSGEDVGANLKTALGNIGQIALDAIVAGIGAVGEGATALIDAVGGLLKSALSKENLEAASAGLMSIGSTIIDAIVQGLSTVSTAGQQIMTAITGLLSGINWADAGSSVASVATGLVNNIVTSMATLGDGGFGTALATMLGNAANAVADAATGVAVEIVKWILSADTWIALGKGVGALLAEAVSFGLGIMIESISGFGARLAALLEEIFPNLEKDIDIGFEVDTSFLETSFTDSQAQGLARDVITQVQNAIANGASQEEVELLIDDYKVSFAEMGLTPEQLSQINSSGLWETVEQVINQKFSENPVDATVPIEATPETTTAEEGESAITALQAELVAGIEAAPPQEATVPITAAAGLDETQIATFASEGISAGQAFTSGVASGMSQSTSVSTAVSTIVTSIQTPLTSAISTARLQGVGISGALGSGISTGGSSVTTAMFGVVTSLKSTLSTATASVRTSGLNFSRGLAQGIRAGKSAVISAATEVAKAAITAANTTLDIGSPSRVMKQTGRWFDEGFAIGIERNVRTVTGAASDMAHLAAAAVSIGNPGAGVRSNTVHRTSTTSVQIDYDRLADAMAQRPVNVDMDGVRVGRIVTRRQNQSSRSAALGLGKV